MHLFIYSNLKLRMAGDSGAVDKYARTVTLELPARLFGCQAEMWNFFFLVVFLVVCYESRRFEDKSMREEVKRLTYSLNVWGRETKIEIHSMDTTQLEITNRGKLRNWTIDILKGSAATVNWLKRTFDGIRGDFCKI